VKLSISTLTAEEITNLVWSGGQYYRYLRYRENVTEIVSQQILFSLDEKFLRKLFLLVHRLSHHFLGEEILENLL
jgi:hypothetical protein